MKKIIILFILTIFLLSSAGSAFALERTDSLTRIEQQDNLIGEQGFWASIFGTPMSVYGTQRSCSNYPIFTDGGIGLGQGDISPRCSGLLQIYNKDGTPYKEVGRTPTDIKGGYFPGNYYVDWTAPNNDFYWYECYSCVAPPCRADSDCDNWNIGDSCGSLYRECSTEQSQCISDDACCTETAGSKCGDKYLYQNEAYTGTKKCSSDGRSILGEILEYKCGSSCSSSLTGYEVYEKCYLNKKVCDTLTLSCITPTCTPNWQCSSWSSCVSNQQIRTCSDSNNCGTTSNKPSTLQSCTPPPPTCQAENLQLTISDDDFKVDIKSYPTSVVKDSTINIVATVTNRGGDGKMLIECGVYPESYVKGEAGWLFSLIGTPQVKTNCVTTEDFVQTKEIALCSGQSIDIPFTFKARKQADTSYIFCQPYERCGVR